MNERKSMAQKPYTSMSQRQRCRLLAVNLSSLYTKPKPGLRGQDDVRVMNELQDLYGANPFKGYRRLTHDLRDRDLVINSKRVLRLMRAMGLQAVYPKLKDYPPTKAHDC